MAAKDRPGSTIDTSRGSELEPGADFKPQATPAAEPEQPPTPPENEFGDLADLDTLGVQGDDVTWTVYRLDSSGQKIRSSASGVPAYVLKFTGTFDYEKIFERAGGGDFYVMARRGRGPVLKSARISIEGEAKSTTALAVIPHTTPAPSHELAQLRGELSELRGLLTTRGPEKSTLDQLREAMTVMREFAPPAPQQSLREAFELVRDMSGEGDTFAGVMRESLPRVLDLLEAHWGGATTSTTSPATPGGPKPVAAARSKPPMMIELLVRAIQKGTEPAELADAAEELLLDHELAQLRMASIEQILGGLQQAAGMYPVLAEPTSIEYVKAFIEQLKNPPAES